MSDIVIYMSQKDFEHKANRGFYHCYWSMTRIPRSFSVDDKVFFATGGYVRGYVEPYEFNPEDIGGETILWDGSDFVPIKPIPYKQFRGFHYRRFDYKESQNE